MENLIHLIKNVNDALNSFIWGPIMLIAFLSVGFMFTIRTGIFQITHLHDWLDVTFLQLFRNKKVIKTNDRHAISQFQSLCTALAGTIGTGNIAGVATAIVTGGPGSIFWMWVSAFLGMMTIYAENVLGIKYRYKNKEGNWVGGAMIYIERGLGLKWLAIIYSIFYALASFGIGNMTQANSIACSFKVSYGVDPKVTGILLMIIISIVIIGGIKRIASIVDKFVPLMSIFYIMGGIAVILVNYEKIPFAFAMIFKEAFNFRATSAGVIGYGIAIAMQKGISRGVFSNEAGLGSSVTVNSASDVKEPVIQGMWGIFEVLVDTLIICTITALAILTSGVYNTKQYLADINNGIDVISGTALTNKAFMSAIPFGGEIVSISIILFAFSTLLAWSYYGERAVTYLFGNKAIKPYKILFVCFINVGCVTSLNLVWDISDTLNGFMAIPNLIAITLMSDEVITITKNYISHKG